MTSPSVVSSRTASGLRRINLAGRHVLVVEDEFLIALDASRSLADVGATVVGPACTRAAAEDVLATTAIDAAVLDIRLPDGLVLRLADRLRQQGTPIMFISGLEQEAVPPDFRDVPYLRKPFDGAELVRVVDYILRSHAPAVRAAADMHTDNR